MSTWVSKAGGRNMDAMGSPRRRDEEAAINDLDGEQDERYHDDTDDDEAEAASPDAPLRGSGRPSTDFDGLHLGGSKTSTWRDRFTDRIPPRLRSAWSATVKWVQGPQPPRIFTITPIFPKIQHAPLALLDRYAPRRIQRFWLLIALYACWLLAFSLILRASSYSESIPGYGSPARLSCASRYWSEGNGCGLNGNRCRPFSNATMAFRCPADCHKQLILNPHAVGDQEVVYKPLVVGGPADRSTGLEDEVLSNAIYRGDSFICASAVHAGFISDSQGGCGVLTLTGEQPSFTASTNHGIESIGFPSYFPHSFGFLPGTRAQCHDLRWPGLAISAFFTATLSIFTTDPAIEKTLLWLGAAWVGALNNETFDRIPIQRLTAHDIQAQPGAVPALVAVVLTIFSIALAQAWSFRLEGRMPRYLVLYSLFVTAILLMLALPGLNLRIHHYILALLLLPGTSFQNRTSMLYQGLLVGMFVNGIARWGFDSLLQTPGELFQGAQQGTLLPEIGVVSMGMSSITFGLGALPRWDSRAKVLFDGISVLVNDVERFRGYGGSDGSDWDGGGGSGNLTWTWHRHRVGRHSAQDGERDIHGDTGDSDADAETLANIPEYFRFAYMAGSQVADFSKAGTWTAEGEWVDMKPGPSL
ncbi:hypothetical protein LTR91_015631 [Friedmanniomyces endolithicus]|uniref:LCCL domain-containing protein n=1 Tax=Friedmanniomyces endolithicus TaxID=329885 RepID=A0AAN6QLV6_9PEZI|nr:hypothetical protein LTR57_015474 [Friedmanniomyces endolithicus]KAK0971246.1 hypothetical protein LTR91_015631 [Friedmanniomyces endolithicus]KAK1006661.1 hypothetical protein LTS01_003025 [Friedmanniomyces endolithicus]